LFAVSPDGTVSASPVGAAATTGPDGKFRVGPGPEGGWIIRLTKPGATTTWVGGGTGLGVHGVVMSPSDKLTRIGIRNARDLVGRVVDLEGRPAAGARLVVVGEAHRFETTTDAEGRFTARPPAGPVFVELVDPRYERSETPTPVPETGDVPEVSIVTRPASPLTGWVAARDGTRLSGVLVYSVAEPTIRTRTDADGRFQLVVDRRLRVAAIAGGYGWRSCGPPLAGELEILLDPTEGLAGRVVDREGRPVADARLTAVSNGYTGNLERVLGPRTASDGSFRFSWLPKPWRGATTPARFVATRRGVGESAILPVNGPGKVGPTNAEVVITGVCDVAGRATRADASAVADAVVEAKWGHWDGGVSDTEAAILGLEDSARTKTDADGRWRLRTVPRNLHARIRCATEGVVLEQNLEPYEPGASFDFVFKPGRPIAGHVVAPDGKPAEGPLDVRAQLLMAQGTEVDRVVRASPDGSFRFEPLPAGDYQITAYGPMYDMQGIAAAKAGDEAVEVRMRRTAALKFRFVFVDGAPPDATLSLVMEPYGGGAVVYRRSLPPGRTADGVELTGVTPGRWTLQVACDTWRASMDRIEPTDGETREVEVRLVRTLRVTGKLFSPDGAPRASTLVVVAPVLPTKGTVLSVVSAADGALDLTGLLPGRWAASVDAPGCAAMRTEFDLVDGANEPVLLRMPKAGSILVRVAPEDAKGAEVVLADPSGGAVLAWAAGASTSMSRFYVDAEGRAVLRGVRPGKVTVEVRSSGSTLKSVPIDVEADREIVVEVP